MFADWTEGDRSYASPEWEEWEEWEWDWTEPYGSSVWEWAEATLGG